MKCKISTETNFREQKIGLKLKSNIEKESFVLLNVMYKPYEIKM